MIFAIDLPTHFIKGLDLVHDRGALVELGNRRYGVSLSSAADDREKFLVDDQREPLILEFKLPAPE